MFDPRWRLLLCATSVCLALPTPARADEAFAAGATLCLYPLGLPLAETTAEERRPALQQRLIDALEAASFRVADPAAVEALEERVREESGGFIDTALGQRDAERFTAYSERLAAALEDELGCDAQLFATVVTLRATFVGGVARWDGTTRKVSSTGRIVMNAIAGVQESGWVSAFSLWLHVTDLLGNDLAFRSAGIETPVQLAVVEDKDVVPEDRWLTDSATLDQALGSALGPNGDALLREGRP